MNDHRHDLEPERRIDPLSPARCRELLAENSVGRVAWNTDRGPAILPVAYALWGDAVVFLTSETGPLAQLAAEQRVAFEVDDFDASRRNAWSVCVSGRSGRARPATGEAAGTDPLPWVAGDRRLRIAISLDEVTGRLLTRG